MTTLHQLFLFESVEKASLFLADGCSVIDIVLRFVGEGLVKITKHILLLLVKIFRYLNNNFDKLVTSASAAERLDTSASEAENVTGLSTGRQLILNLTVKSWDVKSITESRLSIGNVEFTPYVEAVTLKEGMRSYVDVYSQITCRTAVDTRITSASDSK